MPPYIHQKMRNRCKNNYKEVFGAVYWAKNTVLKNHTRLQQPPFGGRGLNMVKRYLWCLVQIMVAGRSETYVFFTFYFMIQFVLCVTLT